MNFGRLYFGGGGESLGIVSVLRSETLIVGVAFVLAGWTQTV